MKKEIVICDLCGKETNKMAEHHTRVNPNTRANKILDVCSDCEDLFLAFVTATPEKRKRIAEMLKE